MQDQDIDGASEHVAQEDGNFALIDCLSMHACMYCTSSMVFLFRVIEYRYSESRSGNFQKRRFPYVEAVAFRSTFDVFGYLHHFGSDCVGYCRFRSVSDLFCTQNWPVLDENVVNERTVPFSRFLYYKERYCFDYVWQNNSLNIHLDQVCTSSLIPMAIVIHKKIGA